MYFYIKLCLDRLMALCLLVVLFIPILVMSLILFLSSGFPVFFTQDRVGYQGKIFKLFKFRTMKVSLSEYVDPSQDFSRLTFVGRIFRKLSLDELPQLVNILKGEMSFIGPRPLLVEYLPLYNDIQKSRHHVVPGITGWAQINGRNSSTWTTRLDHDVYYVDHFSFWLDLKIFFLTIKCILLGVGVNNREGVTMEKFKGNVSI